MKSKFFQPIAKKYKAIFFDSYGVLKNSDGLIDGVGETLRYLREEGIEYFVLTNDASRGPKALAQKFIDKGLLEVEPDDIISSGMMAKEYLEYKVKDGRVAYLGTEDSAHYIEEAGLETVAVGDIDFNHLRDINAMVFLDDEGFDWNTDISKTVNLLRKRNIPVAVANTDKVYPVSNMNVNVAIGGLAVMIENIVGKRFLRFGKPDAQMFIYAYERLQERKNIDRNDILMVGDTLQTDILGGNKFGLDTALVLTGNTQAERAKALIKNSGITPDYICDSAGI